MEMCYDGALVMPSNYAVMREDEMMYTEGGRERIRITITLAMVGAFIGRKVVGLVAKKLGAILVANAAKIAAWFLSTGFVAQALMFTAAGIIVAGAAAFAITLIAKKKVTIYI